MPRVVGFRHDAMLVQLESWTSAGAGNGQGGTTNTTKGDTESCQASRNIHYRIFPKRWLTNTFLSGLKCRLIM